MRSENVEDFYPLSPLQEGLLFHSLSAPESRMYFNQVIATLQGDLNDSAFKRAWQRLLDRHPILRTFFVWEDLKAPIQVVDRQIMLPFEQHDWRGVSQVEQQKRLESIRQAELERGFDLSKAPLMRLVLIQTAEDSSEFIWSFHHILMDGWSMFQAFKEVFTLYQAFSKGQEFHLENLRPYRDYIVWLRQQNLRQAEAYWRKTLKGFTAPTPLVVDRTLESLSEQREEFATQPLQLSAATTTTLKSLSQKYHVTLNTLVQGSWALLLSRYSGEETVAFGTVVSGRPVSLTGVESMVGLFINTLPVRVEVSPQDSLLDWLKKLQAQQVEMRQYEYSPLVEVQGWSEVPRGTSLFESIFLFENYHNDIPLEAMGGSLKIRNVRWFERVNYPLAAFAVPGTQLLLRILYHCSRFDAATITRMLRHWGTLLEGMVANPDCRLSDLPLLTKAERHQLLVEWNDTKTEYPRDKCIHEVFEAQVERIPDMVAVVFEDKQLTYRELNRLANRLAHHLRALGVGPEVPVGICLERSLEMVVGLLGILKAGGAYVPLDPASPKERLAFMLADTQAPVLLTHEKLIQKLPDHGGRVVCLDSGWENIVKENEANPITEAMSENLAYVIYTSGSTGKPKGTSVPHRAVVRLVKGTNYANLNSDEVFLQFAPISFDASTFEIWGSLLNGARLVVLPAHTPSLEELEQAIGQNQVTTLWLTAGLFHQMVEKHPEGLRHVRQLLAGGDVLSVSHVKAALQQLEGCQLINGYGPTENTTFSCCFPMTDAQQVGHSIPIGQPIANTQAYILNRFQQPVPIGVTGELYVGGDGLARDYLNQPELTAERFIPNPFCDAPGARLYRTGDLARYLSDGNIEFLGRLDHQVKIRGFRIELGEVEATLSQHPAVRETVVLAREDVPGDPSAEFILTKEWLRTGKRLVAYIVTNTKQSPPIDELRRFLKEKLPEYMVPSAFVMLDALPLTPNGKVDRRTLPAPDQARPELERAFVAPRTPVEGKLSGIWTEVLGLDQVGIHDNFFSMGGHSILAIQVMSRVRDAFQVEFPLRRLFESPTVADLSVAIVERQAEQADQGELTRMIDEVEELSDEEASQFFADEV